jgi:hypothetical protein
MRRDADKQGERSFKLNLSFDFIIKLTLTLYLSFRFINAHSVLLLLIQYIIAHLNSSLLTFNIAHLKHFITHLDYFIAKLNISH